MGADSASPMPVERPLGGQGAAEERREVGLPVDDIAGGDLAAFLDAEDRASFRGTPATVLFTPC